MGSEEPLGASFIGVLAEEVRAQATERFTEVLRGVYGGIPFDALLSDDMD